MMDLRDRIPKQLTSEGENEDPSWAPDSRHIVFASTRSGQKQLWVMDTESGRMRQLTHSTGARLASWSPILTFPEVGSYSQER
jgi:TolB protein